MDHPEQYSKASKRQLHKATNELVKSVRIHVSHVNEMHGGSSEMPDLFVSNDQLAAAVTTWKESAEEHTVGWPIPLRTFEDDDLDNDEPDEHGGEQVSVDGQLSVFSRWDLAIVDTDAVIAHGREAHRRYRPEENKRDAEAAVHDVSSALYEITHENGEPWYGTDGLEVIHGERIYVRPDEPLAPPDTRRGPDDSSFPHPAARPRRLRRKPESAGL